MKTLVRELLQFNLLTLLTSIALIAVFSAQITGDLGEPLDLKHDRHFQAYVQRARQVVRFESHHSTNPMWTDNLPGTRLIDYR